MAVSIRIDDAERAASVLKKTLGVNSTLGTRRLARFTAFARRGNAWAPEIGDPVRITEGYIGSVFGSGPSAFWRLNDASGNAADSTGHGVTATASGGITYGTAGPTADGATAVTLNGSTGYFAAGDVFGFEALAPFSVEAWIYIAAIHATEYKRVVAKETTDGGGRQGWLVVVAPVSAGGAVGRVSFERWEDNVSSAAASTASITVGAWNHVVCTFDGLTTRVWLNGVGGTAIGSIKQIVDHAGTCNIGRSHTGSYFNGAIANVAIYDRALSTAEIAGHYAAAAETGGLLFAGQVDEYEEEYVLNGTQERRQFELVCVGHEAIADRFLYAGSATSTALGSVVSSIVAEKLAGESINTDNVAIGPILTKVNFPWIPVSQCFDEVTELANYSWWMAPSSIAGIVCLYVQPRSAIAAPWEIDTTAVAPNCYRLKPGKHRETYANVQFVRGGTDLTDPRVETWTGDDETRVFTSEFPVGTQPSSVAVNGSGKTIGIGSVEEGQTDFYWNKGTHEIRQDIAQTVLTPSDVLLVRYEGQYPVLVSAQNDGEITARMAAEGGSGRYELLDDAPSIDDAEAASDKARALLTRRGGIPQRITVWTHRGGLEAGQLLAVYAPEHDLAGQFLVHSVAVSWRSKNRLTYEIELLSGDGVGGWIQFWTRLIEKQQFFVIRENEVVLLLRTAADEVTCADAFEQTSAAPETRCGFATAGFSEVG